MDDQMDAAEGLLSVMHGGACYTVVYVPAAG